MPIAASIEFPQADAAALFSQIERARKELNVSIGSAIRTATNRVALSMGTSTRVSPKYRDFRKTGRWSSNQKFDGKKFYANQAFEVTSLKGNRRKDFIVWARNVNEAKKDKGIRIGRHGLAKMAWRWAAMDAGAGRGIGSKGASKLAGVTARKHSSGSAKYSGDSPWSKMTNALNYASSALIGGQNTVETALERAASAMSHVIDEQLRKKIGAS